MVNKFGLREHSRYGVMKSETDQLIGVMKSRIRVTSWNRSILFVAWRCSMKIVSYVHGCWRMDGHWTSIIIDIVVVTRHNISTIGKIRSGKAHDGSNNIWAFKTTHEDFDETTLDHQQLSDQTRPITTYYRIEAPMEWIVCNGMYETCEMNWNSSRKIGSKRWQWHKLLKINLTTFDGLN